MKLLSKSAPLYRVDEQLKVIEALEPGERKTLLPADGGLLLPGLYLLRYRKGP